jgi:hypothetical protein
MDIRLKIYATTDGKFVGKEIVWNGVSLQLNGFTYDPHEVTNLGAGLWRIHNSNYSADAKEVEG